MQVPVLLSDPPVTNVTEYLTAGGGQGYRRAAELGPGGTIQELILSGLRGRGGGGFSTGRKWQSVREAARSGGEGNRAFVVANGAEGEPATFKDRAIMRANPFAVVEGVAIAAFAVGAERAFVAVKERFEVETDRLAQAVEELSDAGLIGSVPIQVVLGPDHYLYGEETGLLQVVEGEAPLPRNLPPYIHGLFASGPTEGWSAPVGTVATDSGPTPPPPAQGRGFAATTSFDSSNPTVVNNVETLATASLVLARGPEWHRSLGTQRSPGFVVATVVGDVARPGVAEIELGTPLREVVEQVGGGMPPGRSVKAVLSGVSNPVVTADQLDVPCSYEGMEAIGSGLGAAGFMVFDDTTSMVEVAQMISQFLYVESCGQCPACKLGCGAVTERLDDLVDGRATPDDLEVVAFRLETCTDGNRCYLPVEERRVVSSLLQAFPDEVAAALGGEPLPRRDLVLPKIVDLADGKVVYDDQQALKQPDWTYRA
jgi:NADH:ubiquinone oxidoreductase subunit F (NADH-binding)